MFKYKGKTYHYIIWDWRSTLWDPFNSCLYPWVQAFFTKHKNLSHILISFSIDREKRMKMIEQTDLKKYFKHISISLVNKREQFEEVFDQGIAKPDETLVVGDNKNDEIKVAKDLAVDFAIISEFLKEISVAK